MTELRNDPRKLMDELQKPFDDKDIKWRVARGMVSRNNKPYVIIQPYVDNRAIQKRLDELLTPVYWKNEFQEWREKGVICGISIKIGDEWITKWDGSDETQFESTKGGFSTAQRRAAVQWGIGRYLYECDEVVVKLTESKQTEQDQYCRTRVRVNGQEKEISGYWTPPKLSDVLAKQKKTDKHTTEKQTPTTTREPNSDGRSSVNLNNQTSIKAVKALEKYLKLTDAQKMLIYNRLTGVNVLKTEDIYKDNENLNTYIEALRPVAQIKELASDYQIPNSWLFKYLSKELGKRVSSYMSLINLATDETVNRLCERIKQESSIA